MGVSNMKSLILCLALISLVVVNQVEVVESKRIGPRVLDPCERVGNKAPGCGHHKNAPPRQANKYQRGCSHIHRCRSLL
ncbi:hypothetical protein Ddye_012114 [Dipteronia dyeriana]|uniref:Uncharacterized protein n=1 Tax=Dipteronia dyeriana TaxID=168575 RepID=A0AAE0CIY9_9ROSI|nr:hypothetical protein Ddye_012114 [Dipteronia dyeriana]